MMTSLAESLYKSRQWTLREGYAYESPVADLVREIEAEVACYSFTLSRWQASLSSRRVRIRWAIHEGARPDRSDQLAGDFLIVETWGLEGTTKQCDAYRQLTVLLNSF